MGQFPQLIQEDIGRLEEVMRDLLAKSEASVALLVEKAGYLIHQTGDPAQVDTTTFATLGSNAYNAVQFMAALMNESNFTSMYQQGENHSTLMVNVDENTLLVLIFRTHITVGSMKYYAVPAAKALCECIHTAGQRVGASSIDLSDADPLDVQAIFSQKKP